MPGPTFQSCLLVPPRSKVGTEVVSRPCNQGNLEPHLLRVAGAVSTLGTTTVVCMDGRHGKVKGRMSYQIQLILPNCEKS